MSKRYGRNQKRAARQRVAELERDLLVATGDVGRANQRLAHAKEDAFNEYTKQHDMIAEAVKRIGVELGRALGPELAPIAEKILASDRRAQRLPMSPIAFDLSAQVNPYDAVTVIRGEIPSLRYNIALRP